MKAALVLAAALVAPAAAEDRSDRAEAEGLAAAAKARYDARDYAGAIAGYGAAYRRHPSPGLLFNLAQAHRLRGDCAAATLLYHEYLRAVPSTPYRPLAEQHLESISACARGQTLASVSLARADDPDRGRGKRTAGIALGIGGAALLATGAYLMGSSGSGGGYAGRDRHDDDDDERLARGADPDRGELVGAGIIGAGVASLVTGLTLYAVGRREARESRAAFAVAPAGGGVAAQVGWRF